MFVMWTHQFTTIGLFLVKPDILQGIIDFTSNYNTFVTYRLYILKKIIDLLILKVYNVSFLRKNYNI